ANRLHHPRPLRDIEEWALVCGIEELSGLAPEHLNDDRLGRTLEDVEQYIDQQLHILLQTWAILSLPKHPGTFRLL
ncbi:MAG: DUF4277 domain-containing protein, partial [Bacillota bacterium]|nr:DUF4277 domain-containing protein [Bacillota bacterium]